MVCPKKRIGLLGVLIAAGCVAVFLLMHSAGPEGPEHARRRGEHDTLTIDELVIQVRANVKQWQHWADTLLHMRPGARIVRMPTPFFRGTAIYRVFGPTTIDSDEPLTCFVEALVLKTSDGRLAPYWAGKEAQWRRILGREHVSVRTPSEAAQLFRTYAMPNARFLLLERFDDIPFRERDWSLLREVRPDLATRLENEQRRHNALRDEFERVIQPLAFEGRWRRFESAFYALRMGTARMTDLVSGMVTVYRNGNVEVQWREVLEHGVTLHPDRARLSGIAEAFRESAASPNPPGHG